MKDRDVGFPPPWQFHSGRASRPGLARSRREGSRDASQGMLNRNRRDQDAGGQEEEESQSPELKPLMADRPPDASEVLIDMIQEGADD